MLSTKPTDCMDLVRKTMLSYPKMPAEVQPQATQLSPGHPSGRERGGVEHFEIPKSNEPVTLSTLTVSPGPGRRHTTFLVMAVLLDGQIKVAIDSPSGMANRLGVTEERVLKMYREFGLIQYRAEAA